MTVGERIDVIRKELSLIEENYFPNNVPLQHRRYNDLLDEWKDLASEFTPDEQYGDM